MHINVESGMFIDFIDESCIDMHTYHTDTEFVHQGTGMYACMHERTYIHIHIYIHTYTYIHTYVHTYVRTYVHTYIHTYIHTQIHTYT